MQVTVLWFRRDLRLFDNSALVAAANRGLPVLPVFIFDTNILSALRLRNDRRVAFIHERLKLLDRQISEAGGRLLVLPGKPNEVFPALFEKYAVQAVYCNEDYEPAARNRDQQVAAMCKARGIEFVSGKDHVIFAPGEILKDDGSPYQVFTPYMRRWIQNFESSLPSCAPANLQVSWFRPPELAEIPALQVIGFDEVPSQAPPAEPDIAVITNYDKARDFPAVRGTSRLGVHLRFGTISVRQLALMAHGTNQKYLSELIWREFYQMILWHYPQTVKEPFREAYKSLRYPGSEADFQKWKNAETGYDLVDAGIRELVETGFMHNRVRMVVSSFLTKHLLCDWRWGEFFFSQYLLDFEQASNVGGWQWSAGIGVDAAPYFRIFNPLEQQKKYDPAGEYVQQWLGAKTNFFGTARPAPMVDHRFARERCLNFFSTARH